MTHGDFDGAKIALFHAGGLLVYLRDDRPELNWPGHWDLPGGGREGGESPQDCALRELEEEFGLRLMPSRLLWHRIYGPAEKRVHFFAGHLAAREIAAIRFGDEGQFWRMMAIGDYLSHPLGVPNLQSRLRDCLEGGFCPVSV